jgi:hypothetical protein
VNGSVNSIVPSHRHGSSFDAPIAEFPGNSDRMNISFRVGDGGLHSAED